MIKVGIDTIAFYTSRYAIELQKLAEARNVDPAKYQQGLGQHVMSVPPPGEDIVTMAANAAKVALKDIDLSTIEMVLFATESGVDQSKAAGLYIHDLLGLPSRCRIVELKQACYAGTVGIQLALPFLRQNPYKKVLILASDIARYGLNTTGESSQGSGAIAMVLSAEPRLITIEAEYGLVAENVMDFWRPNYLDEALVEGKYSSKLYLSMLEKSFAQYRTLSNRNFNDHAYFCYHSPVPRLVEKAHQYLCKVNEIVEDHSQIQPGLVYGRQIGNSYTASLYIGLISLLENIKEDLTGKRIGFYSYGSGCVAEFFSGMVQPGYQAFLNQSYHQDLLTARTFLKYEQYADFYSFKYVQDGSEQLIPAYRTGAFRLAKLEHHKRIYEKVNVEIKNRANITILNKSSQSTKTEESILKVCAPGKLILSGEHAVVYGQPALAMAINRFVTATVGREGAPQILFDLSDLAHRSRLSFNALDALKARIKAKYHRFMRGDFSIREVLQKPFELAQFALGVLTEALNLSMPHGVKIQVQSQIPIGCGMGSSAATIVSVMHAISHFLEAPISKEVLYSIALEAENMQHGHSSGLDLKVALQGGCLYMHQNQMMSRPLPSMPMYLVNTGTPESSTGQCVEKVAPYFKEPSLANEFGLVTNLMDSALAEQSWQKMHEAVRMNHQLLVRIGVVPQAVQEFVSKIESVHGAAKICGAGAVSGKQAGALLVLTEDEAMLSSMCHQFNYNVIPIAGEHRGVHAA